MLLDYLYPVPHNGIYYSSEPGELFSYLETEAATLAGKEERVKGYRVRVQYQALEEEEKKTKREAVAQVILQSLRRQKEK